MKTEFDTGVIHGRFQVLHNDHLKYLLAGKKLCRHLIVAITNPDPTLIREDTTDPNRSNSRENPLTYYERYTMVNAVLTEAGVAAAGYSIVPLPINIPELYKYYVPLDAVFFLTIYDDWGRKKLEQFRSLGLTTHLLWDVPPEQKGISGHEVRNRILNGEVWENLVPAATAILMKKWDIPSRLKKV